MIWISPRDNAGFIMLDASSAPSAPPAPMIVCSSSTNSRILPACCTSCIIPLIRSSNSPRYFVPATIPDTSKVRIRFSCRCSGTAPAATRAASPSTIAVFPTPGSPIRQGLFLPRRLRIWIIRCSSSLRPISGSSSAGHAPSDLKYRSHADLILHFLIFFRYGIVFLPPGNTMLLFPWQTRFPHTLFPC